MEATGYPGSKPRADDPGQGQWLKPGGKKEKVHYDGTSWPAAGGFGMETTDWLVVGWGQQTDWWWGGDNRLAGGGVETTDWLVVGWGQQTGWWWDGDNRLAGGGVGTTD